MGSGITHEVWPGSNSTGPISAAVLRAAASSVSLRKPMPVMVLLADRRVQLP
jgi:hypothetical protein